MSAAAGAPGEPEIPGAGSPRARAGILLRRYRPLRLEPNDAWRIDLIGEHWEDTVGGRSSYTDEMALTTPNDVGFVRDESTTLDAQAVWESNDGR